MKAILLQTVDSLRFPSIVKHTCLTPVCSFLSVWISWNHLNLQSTLLCILALLLIVGWCTDFNRSPYTMPVLGLTSPRALVHICFHISIGQRKLTFLIYQARLMAFLHTTFTLKSLLGYLQIAMCEIGIHKASVLIELVCRIESDTL